MDFKIKANLRRATTRQALMTNAEALLVGPVYTIVPTILNLDGIPGMLAGAGTAWFMGAALNMPGMTSGAVAALSTHLMYSYANPTVQDVFGKPIWRFDASAPLPPPGTTQEYSFQDRELVPLDNGDVAYGYQATDLPSRALSDRYIGEGGVVRSSKALDMSLF